MGDILEFEAARLEQVEEYSHKRAVIGLSDVERGVRVNVPTTVYQISSDDTSGVIGVLFPSGKFIRASDPRVGQHALYWEFDETLRYETVVGYDGESRVVGNSWTTGEVVWDGGVAGSIDNKALDGEEKDEKRNVVNRRIFDAQLTGEWASSAELWHAAKIGSFTQAGRTVGKIHDMSGEHVASGWRLTRSFRHGVLEDSPFQVNDAA